MNNPLSNDNIINTTPLPMSSPTPMPNNITLEDTSNTNIGIQPNNEHAPTIITTNNHTNDDVVEEHRDIHSEGDKDDISDGGMHRQDEHKSVKGLDGQDVLSDIDDEDDGGIQKDDIDQSEMKKVDIGGDQKDDVSQSKYEKSGKQVDRDEEVKQTFKIKSEVIISG